MSVKDVDRSAGRLRSDDCDDDPILERDVECADEATIREMSAAAWERQIGGLLERSGFYRRKFAELGAGVTKISLDELHDFIRMLDAEGYPRAFLRHGDLRLELSGSSRHADQVVANVTITLGPEDPS